MFQAAFFYTASTLEATFAFNSAESVKFRAGHPDLLTSGHPGALQAPRWPPTAGEANRGPILALQTWTLTDTNNSLLASF